MKKARRLIVRGAVQSMFLEQFVKENADALNIKGFFRKLEDGRVEVFIEGDHEDLEEMIEICKRGPKYSQIRSVDVKEERFQDFKEFKILRL